MAIQILGIGTVADDGTGDSIRIAGDKINDNFTELYTAIGNGATVGISIANPAVGQVLKYDGSSFSPSNFNALTSALDVAGNSIISASNGDITLVPNGTGDVRITAGSQTTIFVWRLPPSTGTKRNPPTSIHISIAARRIASWSGTHARERSSEFRDACLLSDSCSLRFPIVLYLATKCGTSDMRA